MGEEQEERVLNLPPGSKVLIGLDDDLVPVEVVGRRGMSGGRMLEVILPSGRTEVIPPRAVRGYAPD